MSTSPGARRRAGVLLALLLLLVVLPGIGRVASWLSHGPGWWEAEPPAAVAAGRPSDREAAAAEPEGLSRTRAAASAPRTPATRSFGPGSSAPAATAPAARTVPAPAVAPPATGDPEPVALQDTVETRAPRSRTPASSRFRRVERDGSIPGSVASVLVEIPVAGGAVVAYRVETAEGVRLFAAAGGTLTGDDGRARLPLSFSLPADAPAGRFEAGRVIVSRPDGTVDRYPFSTEVDAYRRLTVALAEDELLVTPGGVAEVEVRAVNGGNVVDTLRLDLGLPAGWALADAAPSGVVRPGDTLSAVLRLAAPAGPATGAAAVLRVTTESDGRRTTYPVRLITVAGDGPVAGLAHLPASIFVGSTTADAGSPVMALTAEGEAFPGTKVTLGLRSYDRTAQPAAFRQSLTGPRLHLGVERDAWWLRLGDSYGQPDVLTGASLASRGAAAGWRDQGRSVELSVARPTSWGIDLEEGSVVRARGAAETAMGEVSLALSSIEHTPVFGSPYEVRALATGYRVEQGAHSLSVDAGVMTVADTAAERTGALLDARYQLTGDDARLGLRVRRVPATVQRTASHGNEASLTGSFDATDGLTLSGWGYQRASSQLSGPEASSVGGGAGFRLRLPAESQLQLQGMYRRTEREDRPGSSSRAIRASFDAPFGPATFEASADIGTTTQGVELPYRNARAGLRWSRGSSWGWAGASYQDTGFGTPYATADASGSMGFGQARVFGGIAARLNGLPVDRAVSFWSGSEIPVSRATDLAVGLDYQPYGLTPGLRLSVGLTHRMRLPLPVRRQPVLEGIAFEDRNGNRVLDKGEPTLAGIGVVYGPFRAHTDDAGRFEFFDASATAPRLDPATVPSELILPPDAFLPGRGRVEIPLIRLASLEVELFLDRDGDEDWDAVEAPAEQALATLRDALGRERHGTAGPSGVIRFGGLEGGSYTLTVRAASGRGARELEIEVGPGTQQTVRIALPAHRREIRTPGGGQLGALPPG